MRFTNKNQITRKKEIFRTITKLFKERGYHHTSIKDISNAVGLEGGALYYYIESKEQVLFEIVDNGLDQLINLLEAVNNSDLPPKEKLEAAIRTQVDFFVSNFYETSVFVIETKALSPKYKRQYIAKRDRCERIWRDIVEGGMESGTFEKGDVKLATFGILGMLNWLVIWFKPNKGWSSEKIHQDFTRLIFGGLLKR